MKKNKDLVFKTKNRKPTIEKIIQPFLDRLAQKDYVEGIILLGGLGKRNFLDKYSDIDISIFYKSNISTKYYLPFEFHLIKGEIRYEFNIHQLFYDKEVDKVWDEGTKEAYLRGKIIFDKNKRIKKLIKSKIKFDENYAFNQLIYTMEQYVWRGQIHSIRTYHRGYPEGSHDLLNEALELLIESIYILNKRYRPHRKWRMAMLTTMNLLPKDFFENLREGIKIEEYSLKDINRRIKYLDKIYFEIMKIVKEIYPEFPNNPYEYYFRNNFQLIKSTFSQTAVKRYKNILSDEESEQLEGLLCFNLISSVTQISKYLPTGKVKLYKNDKKMNNEI